MLYNEYLSEEDSYILENEEIKKGTINFKLINFCIITVLLSLISSSGESSIFPYVMLGLASTFSLPLIVIYISSLVGMCISGITLTSFLIFTAFFITFCILTAIVNIEGISKKYVNMIKMIISMFIVQLISCIFVSNIDFLDVLNNTLISGVIFMALVTGIYVLFNIRKGYVFSSEEMVSMLILISLLISNLGFLTIYNVSVVNVLVMMITMIYGWKSSSIMGATAGLTLGLIVASINDFNITFALIVAFSGFIAGTFKKFGKIAVVIGFIIGAVLVSTVFSASSYYMISTIEILIASTIILLIPKKLSVSLDDIFNYNSKLEEVNSNLLDTSKDIKNKLKATAMVFNDMADMSLPVTNETKEETREVLKRYIIKYTENNCIGCNKCKKCSDKELLNVHIDNIASNLENSNEITEDMLIVNCHKSSSIIADLKQLNDSMKVTRLLKKKEAENSKMLSKQYKEMSKIMIDLSKNITTMPVKKSKYDIKAVREELKLTGFRIYEDEILNDENGYMEYTFITDILTDIDKQKESIVKSLSGLLERPMHIKLILNISKTEKSKIKIVAKPDFEISNLSFKGIKSGEEVSGDSYVILNDIKNKYISILSDGVGSSLEALESSKQIINMLEKLLKGGFKEDKAIQIMNSVIKLRLDENSFATLDMCVIDLESLNAEFLKLGAAPTYILSCGRVITVSNHNIPVGLLEETDYIPVTRKLKEDDIIIQISDGVVLDDENVVNNYFTSILKTVDTSLDKNEILEYIKKEMYESKNNTLVDDTTIIVHKVCKN